MASTKKEPKTSVDVAIESIARRFFPTVETLEERGSDSLDFHEVAVWSLKNALGMAFAAGRDFEQLKAAKRAMRIAEEKAAEKESGR